MARALTAFALAAALATVSWFRLEQRDVPLSAVLAVIGIALLPTIAIALGRRRAVVGGILVLATIFAAGVAWEVSPLEARPGQGHDFFGPVLGAARDGLQDFYDAPLPFDRVDYPTMHGLVLIAIFGFTALVGMLAAAKRPVAAGLALLVGVGWPATLLPGDNPLLAGALALAGMLVILFLFRARGRTLRGLAPALVVGGLLVLAAVGASSTEAVAKGAFLRWQQWDLYDRPDKAVSVSYVWASNYDGLRFPKKKTVVMRVEVDGPRRPLYWRATVLEDYNGGTWNETGALSEPTASREEIDVGNDVLSLLPDAGKRRANWVQQEITIQALRDNHLIASAQPVRWRPGTSSNYQTGPSGIVVLEQSLRQGQKYTAWSYVPRARPSQLAGAGTAYPDELDVRHFEPLSGIQVPEFGVAERERIMNSLFATTSDSFLSAHRGLYQTAASLTRESPTPYAAAAVLEAWFRNSDGGGFTYDETPPETPFGEPPLVAFLKDKRGYCQHYAGAMALMLRFVGVPARVAAGFTSGRWDADRHEWTVTDHNAHTWVEVFFPGRGWLAFDPTPGRGNLDAPYSATAAAFDGPDGAIAGLPGAFAAALGFQYYENLTADNSGGTIRNRRNEVRAAGPAAGVEDASATAGETDGGGAALLRLVLLLAGGGALLLVAAKTARRQLRFASKDPRRIASACRSDLVGYLADQGVEAPPSLTLSELGELVETEFAVDSDPYVHSLSRARFGPPAESGPAIRRARRELRLLRRELGRQLSFGRRLRGTLSARSLTS